MSINYSKYFCYTKNMPIYFNILEKQFNIIKNKNTFNYFISVEKEIVILNLLIVLIQFHPSTNPPIIRHLAKKKRSR